MYRLGILKGCLNIIFIPRGVWPLNAINLMKLISNPKNGVENQYHENLRFVNATRSIMLALNC